jgi:hypothetical protein
MRTKSPTSRRFVFAPDVVLQMIDGEALVLKLHEERVFSLNQTGARIAQLISRGHALSQIIEVLDQEYGVGGSSIGCEVEQLVDQLMAKGLIVTEHRRGAK